MKELSKLAKQAIIVGMYVGAALLVTFMTMFLNIVPTHAISSLGVIGYMLITILLFVACYFVSVAFNRVLKVDFRKNGAICSIFVLTTLFYLIAVRFFNPFLVPLFFTPFMVAILISRRVAVISNIVMSLFIFVSNVVILDTGFPFNDIMQILVVNILTGLCIIFYKTTKINRFSFLVFGLIFGVVSVICSVGFSLINLNSNGIIENSELYLFVQSILSSILALAFVPLFEIIFNITTDFRLLELCMNRTGLLKRLYNEAQGTYNHSTTVAHIAEACALKLGLDPYLARASALFHDIGKLKQPNFFKENQADEDNPHDDITPDLSAEILRSHTTYGLELAKQNNLPIEIQNVTIEHHGTLPMKYFYFKAKQFMEGAPDLKDYSYKGKLPQSKISGIIMISDGCEAAVRSIEKISKENISDMVDSVVNERITSGQLNESSLTLAELTQIKEAIVDVLVNIYHTRIEYPNMELPKE